MTEAAPEPSSKFRPTLFHIALLIPWIALVVGAFERIKDNSYLWHIRAGTIQSAAGEVLTGDPFSFTQPGKAWRTQSWLVELGYGWLEGVVGVRYTGAMVLLLGILTVLGIGLIAYRHSRSPAATAIVLLLSAVLLPQFLVPRPALASLALFVLVVLAWDRSAQRWTIPFLFWVWASVHGGFIIGLGYVALRVVEKREWRAWRVLAFSGAACLATAHGVGIVGILWRFLQARPYLSLISEWQTPDLLRVDTFPLMAGILLIIYGATRGRIESRSLWVIGAFLIVAVSAERAIGPAWIALIPFMGLSLRGLEPRWTRGFKRPIALVFAAVILLLPVLFAEPTEIDDTQLPVAAADAMADVRTFHDDYAGGYLIWLSGPEGPVYIDDRAELYGEQITESLDVRSGREDWVEVFQREGIEQVLLLETEPLVGMLDEAGWETTHRDERYVVMVVR